MALTSLLEHVGLFRYSRIGYEEDVFRHLLAVERSRAGRSGSSFVLVLVSVCGPGEEGDPTVLRLGQAVVEALASSVREVDVVGWYRERRIVGALLVQPGEPSREATKAMADRLRHAVGRQLPEPLGARLPVWVKTPRARKRVLI